MRHRNGNVNGGRSNDGHSSGLTLPDLKNSHVNSHGGRLDTPAILRSTSRWRLKLYRRALGGEIAKQAP